MKTFERYPHWVEWSEHDGVHVGRCPDLHVAIHTDDPVTTFRDLRDLMEEIVEDAERDGEPLPEPSDWPGRDKTFCTPPGVLPPWRHELEDYLAAKAEEDPGPQDAPADPVAAAA